MDMKRYEKLCETYVDMAHFIGFKEVDEMRKYLFYENQIGCERKKPEDVEKITKGQERELDRLEETLIDKVFDVISERNGGKQNE